MNTGKANYHLTAVPGAHSLVGNGQHRCERNHVPTDPGYQYDHTCLETDGSAGNHHPAAEQETALA